jgi:type II secretion system protein H
VIPFRSRAGFTLIEVLTVVIIMGIVGAVAVSGITSMTASTTAQQASAALVANVQQAFTVAARRRTPVRISIDTVNKVFRVRDRTLANRVYLTQFFNKESGMAVTRMEVTDTSLYIFPSGLAAQGFTITLHTPGNRRRVTVTRAGQIRVTTP